MRFVVKPEANKTAKLISEEIYTELLDIAKTKNKSKIKDSIYREPYSDADEIRSRVEDQLALSYYNKCAYCERITKADVEHYRPKKGVNEDSTHDGYYWLCYEWTNLIPACVKCNRDGGKHNHFPILGTRLYSPIFLLDQNLDLQLNKINSTPLLNEKPYLLHPEVDNPDDYFIFELDPNGDGIRIKGIDRDGRGEKTIEICSLNRQELRLERVENAINPFKIAVEIVYKMYEEGNYTMDQFVDQVILQIKILVNHSKNEKATHTYLKKYIVKDITYFENIVIPFFPDKIKKIVLEAFKSK